MLRWKSVFLGVLISWTYMAFADHGASHGAPHHSAPVHHEPAPSYSEPHYAPQPHYGYQEPVDPLVPNLYPAAVIGGLGSLMFAYFANRIDQSYNTSTHAFEKLHANVDHRLEKLEEMMDEDKKSNKKLDFKTKALCKLANLFNNPTYEICNNGFDAGQVIGPTGGPHSGVQGYN